MASYYYIDPASQPLNYPSQGAAPVIEYVPPTLPDLELPQLLSEYPIGAKPMFGTTYIPVEQQAQYDIPWRGILSGLGSAGLGYAASRYSGADIPTQSELFGGSDRYYNTQARRALGPDMQAHFKSVGVPPEQQVAEARRALANRPDLMANFPEAEERIKRAAQLADAERNVNREMARQIAKDLPKYTSNAKTRGLLRGGAYGLGLMALMELLGRIDNMPDIPEDIVE